MVSTQHDAPIAIVGQYFLFLIDFMTPRGINAEALLAYTGHSEVSLRQYPEQPIALNALLKLIQNLHTLDPSPTLSLEFGLSLQLSNHGFLGYALQASPTLGTALQLAHKFAQTRSQIISFSFHEHDHLASIRIDDNGALGDKYKYMVETLIACFFSVGRKLLGYIQLDQVRVDLAIDELTHHHVLRQMFNENIQFNCAHTEIIFPASWLATQLPQSDPHLAELAATRCREELQQALLYTQRQAPPKISFVAKVKALLKQEMASSNAQEIIASALHITPRTLHRRLAQDGLQFKTLLDELRQQFALEQLRNHNNMTDIAQALGYSDQANFVRAFKRWTGQTPSQFRRLSR